MIQADGRFFLLGAILLLVLPLDWILAVGFAALFHEWCHIFSVFLLGGRIIHVSVEPGGCVLKTDEMEDWKQFLCILAGPVGSFLLTFLCHYTPKTAICGLFQGLYNLLPVLPLDGGHLIQLLLYKVCPERTDRILHFLAVGTSIAVDLLAIWISMTMQSGIWPILLAVVWNLKILPGKNTLQRI